MSELSSSRHTRLKKTLCITYVPTKCIDLLFHDTVCGMTAAESLVLQILLTQPDTHAVVPCPTPLTLHHSIFPFAWLPSHTYCMIARMRCLLLHSQSREDWKSAHFHLQLESLNTVYTYRAQNHNDIIPDLCEIKQLGETPQCWKCID